MRAALEFGNLNLPPPAPLPNTDFVMPYFFLGDSGFPLERYLITPVARLNRPVTPEERNFNYRQSRARRIIECAFGLLKNKCHVYEKPIGLGVTKVEKIILATVCLHNFLITSELMLDEQHRRYTVNAELQAEVDVEGPDQNNVRNQGRLIRNFLTRFLTLPENQIG